MDTSSALIRDCSTSGCQLGTAEGKRADRLVLEGKHEAAEELYRMQLTRLESQLLDAPSPQLQNEHRDVLESWPSLINIDSDAMKPQ